MMYSYEKHQKTLKSSIFLCSRPKMAVFQIFQDRFFWVPLISIQEGLVKAFILVPPRLASKSLISVSSYGWGICRAFSLILRFSTRNEVASHPSLQTTFFEHGDGALCHLPQWHFKFVLFESGLRSQLPQLHQISLHCCHPLHPSASWLWALLAIDRPVKCPLC